MEILNLDIFEKTEKEIRLKGKVYKVPDSIPAFLYLKLLKANSEASAGNMEEGLETMHKIFQIHQPELSYDEFSMMITNDMYAAVINYLFANVSAEETLQLLKEAKEDVKTGKKKLEIVSD